MKSPIHTPAWHELKQFQITQAHTACPCGCVRGHQLFMLMSTVWTFIAVTHVLCGSTALRLAHRSLTIWVRLHNMIELNSLYLRTRNTVMRYTLLCVSPWQRVLWICPWHVLVQSQIVSSFSCSQERYLARSAFELTNIAGLNSSHSSFHCGNVSCGYVRDMFLYSLKLCPHSAVVKNGIQRDLLSNSPK